MISQIIYDWKTLVGGRIVLTYYPTEKAAELRVYPFFSRAVLQKCSLKNN